MYSVPYVIDLAMNASEFVQEGQACRKEVMQQLLKRLLTA